MNGHDDHVIERLRAAFQQEAALTMSQTDTQTELRSFQHTMRRGRRRRIVLTAAAGLALLAALPAASHLIGDGRTTPPASPAPTSAAALDDPTALRIALDQHFLPGQRYLSGRFNPEFSFEVAGAGWQINPTGRHFFSGDQPKPGPGYLYLVRGGQTQQLNFLMWRRVFDDQLKSAPVPEDIAAWLASNDHLTGVQQQATTVDGLPAVRVDAQVTDVPDYPYGCGDGLDPCLILAALQEWPSDATALFRPAEVAEGATVRFWIVKLPDGRQLVIHAAAPPEAFDALVAEADQIVASLKIAR